MFADEFGGYSKTYKGVDESEEEGLIAEAIRINQMNAEREAEFESIASVLGLDIDKMALKLVSLPSPTHRRQIVRKVKGDQPLH